MRTVERTAEPYDGNRVYEGNCDVNNMYWTTVDVTPVCDDENKQYVDKSSFFCNASNQQIFGIGSYTDTMVQFRFRVVTSTLVLLVKLLREARENLAVPL